MFSLPGSAAAATSGLVAAAVPALGTALQSLAVRSLGTSGMVGMCWRQLQPSAGGARAGILALRTPHSRGQTCRLDASARHMRMNCTGWHPVACLLPRQPHPLDTPTYRARTGPPQPTPAGAAAAALDALNVGTASDAPLLVRLPSRPWGASATLSMDEVKAAAGAAAALDAARTQGGWGGRSRLPEPAAVMGEGGKGEQLRTQGKHGCVLCRRAWALVGSASGWGASARSQPASSVPRVPCGK